VVWLSKVQVMDHTHGFAFLYNGNKYYSPNSSRRFAVPQQNCRPRPFKFDPKTNCYAEFASPSWLLPGFCYFSFLPSVPIFSGRIFSCLQDSEIHLSQLPNKRFCLHRLVLTKWRDLEERILLTTKFLLEREEPNLVILPPPPSLLGFLETDFSYNVTMEKIKRSRDWFLMWIAAATFLTVRKEPGYSPKI
jgi:hypothetical protein